LASVARTAEKALGIINRAKKEVNRAEGQLDSEMDRLADLGYDSPEAGKVALASLGENITKLEKNLKTNIAKFEKEFPEA